MILFENQAEKREKAIHIWQEVIRLIPTDVHVRAAVVDCIPQANEIAEELYEYLQAMQAFPGRPKHDVFFPDGK